jgi:hypothetical protein
MDSLRPISIFSRSLLVPITCICVLWIAPSAKSAGIFWSGDFNNQHGIGSANLDGTGVNQSFIAAPDVSNIAVGGNYLYWVNGNSGTIGRAKLDGSGTTSIG